MLTNLLLNVDSYKLSHFEQYPPVTEKLFSYIEARPGGTLDKVVVFGVANIVKKLENYRVTAEDIAEAEEVATAHGFKFNRAGWEYILNSDHKGRLPVIIHAVPEGTVVPVGNVILTITNSDPKVPWLVSYLETMLLRAIWYPTTVATISWEIKQLIKEYLEKTSDNPESVLPFRLHDFGARGVSSEESAGLGGAAHLVNFMGSDTLSGIMEIRRTYGMPMAGYSIPAAEHSTITSWGAGYGETLAYKNMLDKFAGPGKLVAVVSDSYDLDHAVLNIWGGTLKEQVINQGGTVVIRPDSGNPVLTPIRTILNLEKVFGTNINSKGYKVLPNYIRVIQGDGININSIKEILFELYRRGYSAENIAFGMGGALLQGVTRDTANFAMKASAIYRNGEWKSIAKNPKTDSGKASKGGRLALIRRDGIFSTVSLEGHHWENELVPVFVNGFARNIDTFEKIRERAASYLQ